MIEDPVLVADIAGRWVEVRRRIESAAADAGRDPGTVRVVAVTKGFGPEVVSAARRAGLERFGENRVQEGERKVAAAQDAEWHLIGHLQSNKARRAVEAFDWLEGVDSIGLLRKVDQAAHDVGRRTQVLLQVNVAAAVTQHGVPASDLAAGPARDDWLGALGRSASVDVVGLMAIGPMTDDPAVSRSAFAALRRLRDELRVASGIELAELSMGMSADLEAAVAEGATLVRVGTALFGERPDTA
jgi:pyridoxal phosphate enzyme (YggS family)